MAGCLFPRVNSAAPAGVAGHCARRVVLELRVNRERQAQFVEVRHQ